MTPEDRFWTHFDERDPAKCWEWRRVGGNGYGYLKVRGQLWLAHRYAVEVIDGRTIPQCMVTDHLCRNPPCVNPAHLEIVTSSENTARGLAARRKTEWAAAITHCPQGHEYTPANMRVRNGRPSRDCRICAHDRIRARRAAPSRSTSTATTAT